MPIVETRGVCAKRAPPKRAAYYENFSGFQERQLCGMQRDEMSRPSSGPASRRNLPNVGAILAQPLSPVNPRFFALFLPSPSIFVHSRPLSAPGRTTILVVPFFITKRAGSSFYHVPLGVPGNGRLRRPPLASPIPLSPAATSASVPLVSLSAKRFSRFSMLPPFWSAKRHPLHSCRFLSIHVHLWFFSIPRPCGPPGGRTKHTPSRSVFHGRDGARPSRSRSFASIRDSSPVPSSLARGGAFLDGARRKRRVRCACSRRFP